MYNLNLSFKWLKHLRIVLIEFSLKLFTVWGCLDHYSLKVKLNDIKIISRLSFIDNPYDLFDSQEIEIYLHKIAYI